MEQPGSLKAPYRPLGPLGQGAFGSVHKAVHIGSNEIVAIKVISKEKIKTEREKQSIEQEISTMRRAVENYENGHPNILKLIETFDSAKNKYLVTEFCEGGDLLHYIKKHGRLLEAEAHTMIIQLASGLQFLRHHHFIHRDLKPANLLLSSKDPSKAKLVIADFGFARQLDDQSMASTLVGSPLYVAPELLDFKDYSSNADLWSVGCILYEMLTGYHPFLNVNGNEATNQLALRKNIKEYFLTNTAITAPQHFNISTACMELLNILLIESPERRACFDDFFNSPFLLPALPGEEGDHQGERGSMCSGGSTTGMDAHIEDEDDEFVFVEADAEQSSENATSTGKHVGSTTAENQLERTAEMVRTDVTSPAASTASTAYCSVAADSVAGGGGCGDEAVQVSPHAGSGGGKVMGNAANREQDLEGNSRSLLLIDDEDICWSSPSLQAADDLEATTVTLASVTTNGTNHDHSFFHSAHRTSSSSATSASSEPPQPPSSLSTATATSTSTSTATATATATAAAGKGTRVEDRKPQRAEVPAANPVIAPDSNKIAFRHFCLEDLALFIRVSGPRGNSNAATFLAFNENQPHYYLSEESATACGQDVAYIVGRLVAIDRCIASVGANPYGLAIGADYHLCTVSATPTDGSTATGSADGRSAGGSAGEAGQGAKTWQSAKISCAEFAVQDMALFFHTGARDCFLAFNCGCPHYYLSPESLASTQKTDQIAYVFGEIVMVVEKVASKKQNPYKLKVGTTYYQVTITVLGAG